MFLSIIIPAFNAADYIDTSLKSIGNQSNTDFEIIVVDDGSSDLTAGVAQQILVELGINAYKIIKKQNGGVSSARNSGLEEAKGEYVLFLDADDFIESNLVQCIYEVASNSCPQIVNWIFEEVNSKKEVISSYFTKVQATSGIRSGTEMLNEVLIKTDMFLWTGSLVYNRKFLISKKLKYSEGCISGEDTEFILKSLSLAKEVIFMKKILSYYVKREGSITNSYNVRKFDAIMALQRTGQYMKKINNSRLQDIAEFILEILTIEAYMTHYENCIKYLINLSDYNLIKAINKLENDIESEYKNLSSNIKNLIRIGNKRGLKSNIQILLFKMSPTLYFRIKGVTNLFK